MGECVHCAWWTCGFDPYRCCVGQLLLGLLHSWYVWALSLWIRAKADQLDYTAYNEMLSLFRNIAAIPVPLGEADQYHMSPDKIAEEIARGTSVILTSNPRNPTGQMVRINSA
jgi:hypothetical protein